MTLTATTTLAEAALRTRGAVVVGAGPAGGDAARELARAIRRRAVGGSRLISALEGVRLLSQRPRGGVIGCGGLGG